MGAAVVQLDYSIADETKSRIYKSFIQPVWNLLLEDVPPGASEGMQDSKNWEAAAKSIRAFIVNQIKPFISYSRSVWMLDKWHRTVSYLSRIQVVTLVIYIYSLLPSCSIKVIVTVTWCIILICLDTI